MIRRIFAFVAVLAAVVAGPAAQAAPWATTTGWTRGDAAKLLAPAATHVCVLTRLTGNFRGAGERIALYVQNGNWMLNGTSGQKELAASATCARKADFARYASNPSRLAVKIWPTQNWGKCDQKRFVLGGDVRTDAFFLTGISGKFSGAGESVTVTSAGKGTTGAGAVAIAACSGGVDATLSSFSDTGGVTALFLSKDGKARSKAAGGTAFHVMDSHGHTPTTLEKLHACFPSCGLDTGGTLEPPTPSVDLAPVERALCGLTSIMGKLQGYGEFARIGIRKRPFTGELWWTLEARTQADSDWIWAGAQCLARAP